MVVHSCNLCGFSTQKKSNYDVHIRSKSHQLEESKIEVTDLNKQLNDTKEVFETEKMRSDLLNERLISCEEIIKEKDVMIYQLTNQNNILQERLDIYLKNEEYFKENINMLKGVYDSSNELSKKYLESSNKLIDSTNVLSNKFIDSNNDTSKYLAMAIADSHKALTNTTKVANKSIDAMKFIMENYNDAPNIEDVPIILTEDEMLALEINPISGSTDIIRRVYIEGVDPKQRCTWCMDASRLKFTTKHKGSWLSDPYGKILRQVVMDAIVNQAHKRATNIFQGRNPREISTQELKNQTKRIDKIKHINQEKTQEVIIRRVSGDFILDKESNNIR
jgi:hypothetical protein